MVVRWLVETTEDFLQSGENIDYDRSIVLILHPPSRFEQAQRRNKYNQWMISMSPTASRG